MNFDIWSMRCKEPKPEHDQSAEGSNGNAYLCRLWRGSAEPSGDNRSALYSSLRVVISWAIANARVASCSLLARACWTEVEQNDTMHLRMENAVASPGTGTRAKQWLMMYINEAYLIQVCNHFMNKPRRPHVKLCQWVGTCPALAACICTCTIMFLVAVLIRPRNEVRRLIESAIFKRYICQWLLVGKRSWEISKLANVSIELTKAEIQPFYLLTGASSLTLLCE